MKSKLLTALVFFLALVFAFFGCSPSQSSDQNALLSSVECINELQEVYEVYLQNANALGKTPLSFDEWILSIKNEGLTEEEPDGSGGDLTVCAHDFGAWQVELEPTCSSIGYSIRQCELCEAVEYEFANQTDHNFVLVQTLEDNCLEKKLLYACSKCSTIKYVNESPTKQHNYKNEKCTVCGEKQPENEVVRYEIIDGFLYFGEYPQTIKAHDVSITQTVNEKGYYLGSDGEYYARVTAEPSTSSSAFSNGLTITKGATYYFKVEPIKWKIIKNESNVLTVVCASAIANRRFDGESANYADSEIRAWLNGEFLNLAFSDLQKQLILLTEVDNGVASTGYNPNPNACENTNDRIYLLSYAEFSAIKSQPNFSGVGKIGATDYSMATGVAFLNSAPYLGKVWWWLRSPSADSQNSVREVTCSGDANSMSKVDSANRGVVPALQIQLLVSQ